jgi:ribonuclease T2
MPVRLRSGPNSHLWSHEYNKHASCINTLSRACYGETYKPGIEVVDYFTRAYQLFRALDTFTALALSGIAPDSTKLYPLAQIQKILEEYSGGKVILRCRGPGRDLLHEAWFMYFVKGSLQSGDFIPAKDLGEKGGQGNCKALVRYLPKRCRGGYCGGIGEL